MKWYKDKPKDILIELMDLQKFDPTCLISKETFVIMVVGKRQSGKTFLIKDLIYHTNNEKNPIGSVICERETECEMFEENNIPKSLIHCKYNPELIADVFKLYSKEKQYGIIPVVILDDNLHGNLVNKYDVFGFTFRTFTPDDNKNTIKYLLNNTKAILSGSLIEHELFSSKIDYVFIFRDSYITQSFVCWFNYGITFTTQEIFSQVLEQYTQNNGCLVIHVASTSNNIQDKVFWYRAEEVPKDFKPFIFDESMGAPIMK